MTDLVREPNVNGASGRYNDLVKELAAPDIESQPFAPRSAVLLRTVVQLIFPARQRRGFTELPILRLLGRFPKDAAIRKECTEVCTDAKQDGCEHSGIRYRKGGAAALCVERWCQKKREGSDAE
jgi:hypothetical protein